MEELLRRGDPAELLGEVGRLVDAGAWDALVTLRDRCDTAAEELGKQLWPVARYADYRLALDAPAPYAAAVCRPEAGRFTLGPLTEVAASTHGWEELADHLTSPWVAASVAQERVLRGEDLSGDPRAHADELDLPLHLMDWEPDYPLPVYKPREMLEGGPPPPRLDAATPVGGGTPPPSGARPDVERALAEVGASWADESAGAARIVSVSGDAAAAGRALDPGARIAEVAPADALARLAWAAASGGAYGRRRGMAAGRSTLWWVCHVATGLDFPADPADLGQAVARLRWHLLDGGREGWSIRLVVSDPDEGWAAGIDAWDAKDEPAPDAPPDEADPDAVAVWLLGGGARTGGTDG